MWREERAEGPCWSDTGWLLADFEEFQLLKLQLWLCWAAPPAGNEAIRKSNIALSNVTHLFDMDYAAVELPGILLSRPPLSLNRKSMSHFPTQFCSLVSLMISVFFWSLDHSDIVSYLLCFFLLLFVLHCVGLSFNPQLNGFDLYFMSGCAFLLSLVSMGTVPGCHSDSAGRVMLSHVGGLSWQEIRERETARAQDVI